MIKTNWKAKSVTGGVVHGLDASHHVVMVYSFGITLWEILARKRPFDGLDHFEIQTAWIINPEDMRLPAVKADSSLGPQAAGIMADLSRLVTDCTAVEPDARPTAKEIVARLKKAGKNENG
eukprot:scaffold647889_cov37-Prasinocladus_malaysianus.AAC.1